jgi:hypothetical protein
VDGVRAQLGGSRVGGSELLGCFARYLGGCVGEES